MSHEMRTPLNGVIGITQLALESSRQPEVIKHLEIVQVSAKGLLGLINDVLDFSKIESGLLEIVPIAFALRPFAAEVCSMLRPGALSKGLALESTVGDSVPQWVLADDGRLRQVLVNLIGNALKFTHAGMVSVAVAWAPGRLSFAVSDTGIGIPADKQETIFDAFHQADSSTSRRYGGTGLGLTISKKLVDSMGGTISLDSEPGKGSTFSFTIDAPEAPALVAAEPCADRTPASSMSILVAEDNRVNQYLMRALLGKRGHTVTVAENGVEALAALERGSFDLVLMDVQMPEMDGLEAVRRIRDAERSTSDHIPVVALTARAMTGDRETILAAGMDEYLEKPVQIERLEAVLRRFSG
jgi:CheY-like chemotaxis protein